MASKWPQVEMLCDCPALLGVQLCPVKSLPIEIILISGHWSGFQVRYG